MQLFLLALDKKLRDYSFKLQQRDVLFLYSLIELFMALFMFCWLHKELLNFAVCQGIFHTPS